MQQYRSIGWFGKEKKWSKTANYWRFPTSSWLL